jgi:broad specificity phosphatase PhoE
MAEAVARCDAFVGTLARACTTSLCVSHCDIIRGLVAATLGLSFDRMFGFDCDPASLTTLRRADHGWQLATLNQHAD